MWSLVRLRFNERSLRDSRGGRDLDLLLFLRQVPATSRETDLFERGERKKERDSSRIHEIMAVEGGLRQEVREGEGK